MSPPLETPSAAPALDARPLDPAWLPLVDRLAPRVLGRDDRTGPALGAEVARVSELYTRERHAIELAGSALAARLRFWLPRDLPKIEGPLAELAAVGALPEGPVWRVIDVGAGLGTTSLGAAAFAKRAGIERLDVIALEREKAALDVFEQLAREAAAEGLIAPVRLEPRAADLETLDVSRLPKADLILLGLSLNELHADRDGGERLDDKERMLRALASRLAPGGSLIVIEPGTKRLGRELSALRDRIVADPAPPFVFSPCLRDGECPMLRRERDWCHAQLAFELPEPLAETARAAGLRFERLTYAELVLRNDERRLWDLAERDPRALRIVGGPVTSKGKVEWDGCGAAGLVRIRRMDREASDASACMDEAARGTIVRVDRDASGEQLRLRPDVRVERLR